MNRAGRPGGAGRRMHAVVRAYLDERRERRIDSAREKVLQLSDQLDAFDGGQAPASLRDELARQETAASSHESDAWLQSPCEIATR